MKKPRSAIWLSLDQINRRRAVLDDVMLLVNFSDNDRSREAEYRQAISMVARPVIEDAQRVLFDATIVAQEHGGAPVSAAVVELVTRFNRIRPSKLHALAIEQTRRRSRAAYDDSTSV